MIRFINLKNLVTGTGSELISSVVKTELKFRTSVI